MDEHQAHLQQHLEPVRNDGTVAVGEALGAVATLEQEAFALLGFCMRVLISQDVTSGGS
jgi:hypothetical protein